MLWEVAWSALLVAVGLIDLRERRLPNLLTYGGTAVAVLVAVLEDSLPSALLGGSVALLFFGALYLLGRPWGGAFGLGDVKLAVLVGVISGWPVAVPALLLSVLLGGLVAAGIVVLQIAGGRYRPGTTMAYGPFLALGGLVALWADSWLLGIWQGLSL